MQEASQIFTTKQVRREQRIKREPSSSCAMAVLHGMDGRRGCSVWRWRVAGASAAHTGGSIYTLWNTHGLKREETGITRQANGPRAIASFFAFLIHRFGAVRIISGSCLRVLSDRVKRVQSRQHMEQGEIHFRG
jgi:hypothetical protein